VSATTFSVAVGFDDPALSVQSLNPSDTVDVVPSV
jgi:hypothetical protein